MKLKSYLKRTDRNKWRQSYGRHCIMCTWSVCLVNEFLPRVVLIPPLFLRGISHAACRHFQQKDFTKFEVLQKDAGKVAVTIGKHNKHDYSAHCRACAIKDVSMHFTSS